MDIIAKNPYRYLGVYSNSPTKERVANKGKMNAFLKVGKTISFPLDFPNILPDINRSTDSVANAESQLTLPIDQIRFAQYWWMNLTPLDGIAFNHLMNGNTDMAKTIWDKKVNVSSLQNNFVLACINEEWVSAIRYAEVLYTNFSEEFRTEIVGNNLSITTPLWQILIDSFCEAKVNILSFIDVITDTQWRSYIAEKTINPLIDAITNAIETAKASKGKGSTVRLQAGEKLMTSTKGLLTQLKAILPTSDIRYQTIADKLGLEILQCGIDYYNGSDAVDAAHNAMKLQSYAQSIVVGKMAKDRCKENVKILQKIIDELPPVEVFKEDRAIKGAISLFLEKEYHLKGCKSLLFGTAQYLVSMKAKLGRTHSFYIDTSTLLANVLLNFVIDEFNKEVNDSLKNRLKENERATLFNLMWTLRFCWNIVVNIGKLDTSKDFQNKRYKKNMDSIENFISKIDTNFNPLMKSPCIVGEYAASFLRQYYEYWGIDNNLFSLRFDRNDYLYKDISSVMGIRIAPTNGFMNNWIDDEMIDLRTEDDFYKECTEAYGKKSKSYYTTSYDVYIEKFPAGKYLEDVKLYKKNSMIEHKLFQDYSSSIDKCKQYIEKYPNGWYISEIKEKLDDLFFADCQQKQKEKFYIFKYPNGRNVTKAKESINKRVKKRWMWLLALLMPTAVIYLFVILNWSIVLAIIIAILIVLCIYGSIDD